MSYNVGVRTGIPSDNSCTCARCVIIMFENNLYVEEKGAVGGGDDAIVLYGSLAVCSRSFGYCHNVFELRISTFNAGTSTAVFVVSKPGSR